MSCQKENPRYRCARAPLHEALAQPTDLQPMLATRTQRVCFGKSRPCGPTQLQATTTRRRGGTMCVLENRSLVDQLPARRYDPAGGREAVYFGKVPPRGPTRQTTSGPLGEAMMAVIWKITTLWTNSRLRRRWCDSGVAAWEDVDLSISGMRMLFCDCILCRRDHSHSPKGDFP
jgi:hypothetical protein